MRQAINKLVAYTLVTTNIKKKQLATLHWSSAPWLGLVFVVCHFSSMVHVYRIDPSREDDDDEEHGQNAENIFRYISHPIFTYHFFYVLPSLKVKSTSN